MLQVVSMLRASWILWESKSVSSVLLLSTPMPFFFFFCLSAQKWILHFTLENFTSHLEAVNVVCNLHCNLPDCYN